MSSRVDRLEHKEPDLKDFLLDVKGSVITLMPVMCIIFAHQTQQEKIFISSSFFFTVPTWRITM